MMMEAVAEVENDLPQPLRALAMANAVRIARAHLKRDVKARVIDICEVIRDPPDFALAMPVTELLKALPRVGDQRAEVIVRGICRPTLELGKMGSYTRGRLADRINEIF